MTAGDHPSGLVVSYLFDWNSKQHIERQICGKPVLGAQLKNGSSREPQTSRKYSILSLPPLQEHLQGLSGALARYHRVIAAHRTPSLPI